jgi:hypothetical protein
MQIAPRDLLVIIGSLAFGCALGGCSSSHIGSSPYPYKPGSTSVIGASGPVTGLGGNAGSSGGKSSTQTGFAGVSPVATFTTATPGGGDCIGVKDACVKPQDACGADATADVIVGPNGEVLSTICYPNRDYDVLILGDAPTTTLPLRNNTVIVLDNKADGVDVKGDLHITGNNVIVYGYGPEVSVIGGNLDIDKNNAIVRGVTIEGNASISKNNASLVDCVIKGDLHITGNNVNVALCQIWGNVTIEGKNAVFVSNLVSGDKPISGDNLRCNDNHFFADANMDDVIQPVEVTAPITCESRGQAVANTPNLQPKKP